MDNKKFLSSEWKKWVIDNHNRGCSNQSILEIMIANGYDRDFSTQFINNISQEDAVSFSYENPISHISPSNTINLLGKSINIRSRFTNPDIVLIDNFLSNEECDFLISESRKKLLPSAVIDTKSGSATVHAARISQGMFFKLGEFDLLRLIEERISNLVNMEYTHGEGMQVLHYEGGGEYKPHYDYFPPNDPGAASFLLSAGQRVCTIIMYLNNTELGGETIFPKMNFSVMPKKGSALYFSYFNQLEQLDSMTLHGSLPVVKGEKWIATKWMRQKKLI